MVEIIQNGDQSRSQLIIAGEDIPFGAYQAIYHSLTKKVERRTKSYKPAYDINFEDFFNLHTRLKQATQQYSVKSDRCQVTHQLSDETSREHSSFEKFKFSDISSRSCTTQIDYEFDFLVVLPAEIPEVAEVAQRYKVRVNISQEQIFEDDEIPYFIRQIVRNRHLTCFIEFADYSVSQALQSVVDQWVDSLPQRSPSRLSKVFSSIEQPTRFYLPHFVRGLTLIGGSYTAYFSATIRESISTILIFLAFSGILSTFCSAFIDRAYDNKSKISPMTNIIVTQGDRDRIGKIKIKRTSRTIGLRFLFIGILLTVVLSVFSNFIYDSLKNIF